MAIYNPYRTRPDDETVTQPNFGGVRSVSFTDPTTISRDRALADSLRQQSMTPLNMGTAGGYVIPPSPMQGIAKLGEAAAAVFAEKKAREKEEANKQLRSDAVAKALRLQQEGVADTIQPPSIPLSAQSSGGSYVPPTQEIRRKPTQTEVLGALAEGGPKMEELIAESQIKNLLADASGSSSVPTSIQEFNMAEKLRQTDPDAYNRYMQGRHAKPNINLGGKVLVYDYNKGEYVEKEKSVKPEKEEEQLRLESGIDVEKSAEIEKNKTEELEKRVRKELTLKTDNISKEKFEQNKGNWTATNTKLISGLQTARYKRNKIVEAVHEAKDIILKEKAAGWNGIFSSLPESSAKKLTNKLLMIKSNIGFGVLAQMRADSPTGGAVGQLTDDERKALEATVASLDIFQEDADLISALDRVVEDREGLYERMITAYQSDYAKYGEADDKAYEDYTPYPAYEGPDVKLKKIKRYNPKTDEIEEI